MDALPNHAQLVNGHATQVLPERPPVGVHEGNGVEPVALTGPRAGRTFPEAGSMTYFAPLTASFRRMATRPTRKAPRVFASASSAPSTLIVCEETTAHPTGGERWRGCAMKARELAGTIRHPFHHGRTIERVHPGWVDPKLALFGATVLAWLFVAAWTVAGLTGIGAIFPVTP